MLIGLVDEMSSQDVAHLSDWADHHARTVPNPTWKRAYSLIREGCDLLLRRRAMATENEGWEPLVPSKPPTSNKQEIQEELKDARFPATRTHKPTPKRSCGNCSDPECGGCSDPMGD